MPLDDRVGISDLYSEIPSYLLPLFAEREYPWEILPDIREYARRLAASGISVMAFSVINIS